MGTETDHLMHKTFMEQLCHEEMFITCSCRNNMLQALFPAAAIKLTFVAEQALLSWKGAPADVQWMNLVQCG